MSNAQSTSLNDALEIFLLDARSRRLSSLTVEFYTERLGQFFNWLHPLDVHTVQQIDRNLIRVYLTSLQDRGLKAHSQHAAARAIKTFCRFCVDEEFITESPMRRVRMPKTSNEPLPAFTVDEVNRLLSATQHDRDKAIVLCLLDSGCRAAEFLSWTGGDIDTKTGAVRVGVGKWGKSRTVYLGAKSLKALLRYFIERGKPATGDPVWLTMRGEVKGMTYAALRSMLMRLADSAGVDDVSPHRFRRTFALWSLRNGMSIYELQRLMGHSDIVVLRRYLALTETDLAKAHKRFGAVDNMNNTGGA